MKVSDYIAQRLAAEGIDKVFLVQGACNNDLIYSISDTPGIDYVCAMHEQSSGFMAEGFAKVTGKPGVAIVTSGPGGGNLVTPIQNCYYDSVPAIFITGQINSKFLRPDAEVRQIGFQETPIAEIVAPITKNAVMVRRPQDIRYELERAIWLCQDRRPGPVLLDIPLDMQKAEIEPERLYGFTPPRIAYSCIYEVSELVDDLERAERPVLLIGGGVRTPGAVRAFEDLAENLGIPVYPTWNALDVVPDNSTHFAGRIGTYGGAGRNFGIQNSDLLISIGCRLSGRITGGRPETFARGARKYVVDVDLALLDPRYQQVKADVNCFCDAEVFMRHLTSAWNNRMGQGRGRRWGLWLGKCMSWRRAYDPVKPEFFREPAVHPYAFVRALSEAMPADAIVVTDCGGNLVTVNHAFETKQGQRFFSSNGNSPMGFSFAAAIGAWFADPSRPVVAIIGDGGMNMNIQELQTLKNYGVAVKTFILNNHIYGITKAFQETNFAGRAEACGPKGYRPPNFLAIADAYAVRAMHVHRQSTVARMNQVIGEVLSHDGAVVCDVDIDEHHRYEPRLVGWNTPIEDMSPQLPREEFRANMIVEPLPGWQSGNYEEPQPVEELRNAA